MIIAIKFETFIRTKVVEPSRNRSEGPFVDRREKAKEIIKELERDAVDVEVDESSDPYDYPFIEDDTKEFRSNRDKLLEISLFG